MLSIRDMKHIVANNYIISLSYKHTVLKDVLTSFLVKPQEAANHGSR